MLFAKRRLRRDGERATAEVLSCEYRSKLTSNELRDFDYVLRVQPAAGEAFEANVRDKFWIVGLRPKEGDEDVPVCFDPTSHETVFGDFEGDPRYDVDAMNARTKALRAETRAQRERLGP
jgi:hypothetical protein